MARDGRLMPPGWTIEVTADRVLVRPGEPGYDERYEVHRAGPRHGRLIGPDRFYDLTADDIELLEGEWSDAVPVVLDRYGVS